MSTLCNVENTIQWQSIYPFADCPLIKLGDIRCYTGALYVSNNY